MSFHIIGTSHIAKESIEEIKKAVSEQNPQIIAVELDLNRAKALLSQQKNKISFSDLLRIGIKGFLFAKIGQFVQQKLGKMVGVSPGAEMKTALELAKKKKIEVALIDQPIDKTLKNFSQHLTWKEKWRFVEDLFLGIFFQKRQIKKMGFEQLNLSKVPSRELIEKMMEQLKHRYPNIYKTLVEDRNRYMVKKLIQLQREKPSAPILVIVGAGHKKGMEELLLKVDVV